jgi:hypothetical protein
VLRMQFFRTVFEYAQSIGDTFGAISGGEFENFACKRKIEIRASAKVNLFTRRRE